MSELMYSDEELQELNRAIMVLKDFCKVSYCSTCPFHKKNGCKLETAPQGWEEVER